MSATEMFAGLARYDEELRTRATAAGIQVHGGPVVSGNYSPVHLATCVPAPGDTSSPAVRVVRTGPGGLTSNPGETWYVTCAISARVGSGSIEQARAAALAAFDVACDVVKDLTLSGTVQQVRIGDWTLWNLQSDQGAEVLISYELVGAARLRGASL